MSQQMEADTMKLLLMEILEHCLGMRKTPEDVALCPDEVSEDVQYLPMNNQHVSSVDILQGHQHNLNMKYVLRVQQQENK